MTELLLAAPGACYLINPGSVGQPRDGDPRAAFALLDLDADGTRTVRFRRVPFDATACLVKAARAGLQPAEGPLARLRAALGRLA